jgi:hypothetical protein
MAISVLRTRYTFRRGLPLLFHLFLLVLQTFISSSFQQITMPTKKRKNNKNNEVVSIVGPDSMQVLQGTLFGKNVSLVLCGETHEDAIDVTRKGGVFEAKEGWIELNKSEIMFQLQDKDDVVAQVFATGKKSLSIGNAQEWAQRTIEGLDILGSVVLLWVREDNQARVSKGKAFVLGFASQESLDEYEDDDDDDDEPEAWISPHAEQNSENTNTILPASVREWMLGDGGESSSLNHHQYRSFEWGDLDSQAFELNRRRLTDEELDMSEYDRIIEQRKSRLRDENIWTWDDWFDHIRNTSATSEIDTELIIEQSVPPWELALHRPSATDDPDKIHLPPAAEFIRSMPDDEEGDIEDDYDPSQDGVGFYLHFIYRRFMEEMINDTSNHGNGDDPRSTWLHCVDVRDLGCQGACHSRSVEGMWKRLLTPDETSELMGDENDSEKKPFVSLEPDKSNEFIKFVPECRMNPERIELENMRSSGLLTVEYEDEDEDEDEDGDEDDEFDEGADFTFPSFEGFFGQNTDFLYYSPHVKLYYSPFLAKCVKSSDNWEQFFTNLFLGGTIPDALALLDLDQNKDHIYVRSAIQKICNEDTGSFEYTERDDGEHYITYPFFPFIFYLCAKESSPPRTFSSQLFARVCDRGSEPARIAQAAREWALAKVQQCADDPKGNDDPQCGGEWFAAYLYAVHREIHEDIDLTDAAVLLQRNKMKSLTSGRKYNIGKIRIPSCKDGFDEIMERYETTLTDKTEQLVTPRVEVMADILIDIWMSCLVDFTTLLRIAEIVSRERANNKIIIAVYMGSAHTRALSDFCVSHMGFKKKSFIGKTVWDECEPRTLKLPKNLWKAENLFP